MLLLGVSKTRLRFTNSEGIHFYQEFEKINFATSYLNAPTSLSHSMKSFWKNTTYIVIFNIDDFKNYIV